MEYLELTRLGNKKTCFKKKAVVRKVVVMIRQKYWCCLVALLYLTSIDKESLLYVCTSRGDCSCSELKVHVGHTSLVNCGELYYECFPLQYDALATPSRMAIVYSFCEGKNPSPWR